jgi:hypothetical protein
MAAHSLPLVTPEEYLGEFAGMDAICHFQSLNGSIPLSSVYKNVPFTGPGSEQAANE